MLYLAQHETNKHITHYFNKTGCNLKVFFVMLNYNLKLYNLFMDEETSACQQQESTDKIPLEWYKKSARSNMNSKFSLL